MGYFVDDVHNNNMMVSNTGIIKIIDGELYTAKELDFQKKILNKIDDSQVLPSKPYKYASNIIFWIDGRLSGEDVCSI